tara:strand:- start:275 stop:763 length:489 start_codon:yes stop_codon:yes gene_type:complete
MDSTERLMLHNAMNDYKTENNKLTEQVLERDTHIDILDKEISACRQVNAFAMTKLKDIITEMDLAEMIGLGKDTGTDIAITHMAVEHKKLKEENEELKQFNEWNKSACLKWNEEVEVNRRMKELNLRNVKLIKDMIKNESIRINNIQDEGDVYDLLQELEDC